MSLVCLPGSNLVKTLNMLVLVIVVFVTLFAEHSVGQSLDPSKYCSQKQFMVTQVGMESIVEGGNNFMGRHRIFSAKDFQNGRFYTNYTLTLQVDTVSQALSTVGYEIIIDVNDNAHYEIRNGNCKKCPLANAVKSHLSACLSDKMTHQGSSSIGRFSPSPQALRLDTFSMKLEKDDDDDNDDGGINGLTGELWVTYTENLDDPGTYFQVKEDMIGSVNVPSLATKTISTMFSSDFVDYKNSVDEAKFKVPDFCPDDYSQSGVASSGSLSSSLPTGPLHRGFVCP